MAQLTLPLSCFGKLFCRLSIEVCLQIHGEKAPPSFRVGDESLKMIKSFQNYLHLIKPRMEIAYIALTSGSRDRLNKKFKYLTK